MSDQAPVRIVVPDLISPSYFPAIAAVELGCIARRGSKAELSLHFPVTSAVDALRAGDIDVVAGSAHAMFHGAADAGGVRLLAALSHHTYWFLVVRTDLGLGKGSDLARLRGLRIGAAPGPDDGLRQMLTDAGVDPGSVDIRPVPGASGGGVSFGVTAVEALVAGSIDGFWANGMGAQLAVRKGVGTVLVDARRGDGPPGVRGYTFPALMSTQRLERDRPDALTAVVAGLVEAQERLREHPELATAVARRLFPPLEAELTEALIARDGPYYDPVITEETVADLVRFARQRGLTDRSPGMDDLVSTRYRPLWRHRA